MTGSIKLPGNRKRWRTSIWRSFSNWDQGDGHFCFFGFPRMSSPQQQTYIPSWVLPDAGFQAAERRRWVERLGIFRRTSVVQSEVYHCRIFPPFFNGEFPHFSIRVWISMINQCHHFILYSSMVFHGTSQWTNRLCRNPPFFAHEGPQF